MVNASGFTQHVPGGTELGRAAEATILDETEVPPELAGDPLTASHDIHCCEVLRILATEDAVVRTQKLLEMVGKSDLLSEEQTECLNQFLGEHHEAFSIDPGERRETSLVQIEMDTLFMFAVRQEVARQLKSMQKAGVI